MKRIFGVLVATLVLFGSLSVQAQMVLVLDGLELEVEEQFVGGVSVLPIRAVFEALDFVVEWDDGLIRLVRGDELVTMNVGSAEFVANGTAGNLSVPVQVLAGDRAFAPVESLFATLGISGIIQTPVAVITEEIEAEVEVEVDVVIASGNGTRIDILHHTDLHGMIDGFISAADPGAGLFSAFVENWRLQNPNPDNVILVAGGDNYHGHPVSNYLEGQPVVWLYEFLNVRYSALGNHEFSFGSVDRARYFGEHTQFLAADLFVAGTDEHPDWVLPYTIIQDGEAVVAMIGLMTSGMSHLVSQALLGEFDLRTPTIGVSYSDGLVFAANYNPDWTADIEALIEHLREEYGAAAVVALTHMGTGGGHGAEADILANLIDGFDVVLAGHTHLVNNRETNETIVVEAGWHGRTWGRISFHFDENGGLYDITSELSGPANIDGNPNPDSIINFELNPDFQNPQVQAVYTAANAQVDTFWDEAGEFLNQVVGVRGIPGADTAITDNTELRNHRNAWVTELVEDYINRNTSPEDWTNTIQNDWVYVSNFGGWRNMGPWHWESTDNVTMLDMLATMPFNNAILLFEMQGNDLLTLLNMEATGNADLSPPAFGLNGGQPAVVAGATRGEQIGDFVHEGITRPRYSWYLANGDQISDDDTIYRVAGSNFIWGGLDANGGDRFPFPGNNHGNALGMTFISQPVALLSDGSLVPWPEVPTDSSLWEEFGLMLLRDAMIATLQHRH
ncbi:MAG: metallophosphoesterase [Turicibacter sp.]|nr:metallophosphoesterase [Turicibacter sp.]